MYSGVACARASMVENPAIKSLYWQGGQSMAYDFVSEGILTLSMLGNIFPGSFIYLGPSACQAEAVLTTE